MLLTSRRQIRKYDWLLGLKIDNLQLNSLSRMKKKMFFLRLIKTRIGLHTSAGWSESSLLNWQVGVLDNIKMLHPKETLGIGHWFAQTF